MPKLIQGVGLNDSNYQTHKYKDGKQVWVCPFYKKWANMLYRAYCPKFHKTQPTYKGSSVCNDWHSFINFKNWMESQDWHGKELDKDLLIKGNKIYSPETCVLVDRATNVFITDRKALRGEFMIGVSWHKASNKFTSRCNNPFTGKYEHLGLFTTEVEAHSAWRERKHELSIILADLQDDERVSQALRVKYLPNP